MNKQKQKQKQLNTMKPLLMDTSKYGTSPNSRCFFGNTLPNVYKLKPLNSTPRTPPNNGQIIGNRERPVFRSFTVVDI